MKKLIALVLALICVLGLVGCVDNQQNISGQDENQLIYGEPQEPSDTDIINGDGEPLEIEGISQEEAEEIALEQCKVNYDYIRTEFNHTEKRWSVEFWETTAKVPAQTILVDTEGNVTGIRYAE